MVGVRFLIWICLPHSLHTCLVTTPHCLPAVYTFCLPHTPHYHHLDPLTLHTSCHLPLSSAHLSAYHHTYTFTAPLHYHSFTTCHTHLDYIFGCPGHLPLSPLSRFMPSATHITRFGPVDSRLPRCRLRFYIPVATDARILLPLLLHLAVYYACTLHHTPHHAAFSAHYTRTPSLAPLRWISSTCTILPTAAVHVRFLTDSFDSCLPPLHGYSPRYIWTCCVHAFHVVTFPHVYHVTYRIFVLFCRTDLPVAAVTISLYAHLPLPFIVRLRWLQFVYSLHRIHSLHTTTTGRFVWLPLFASSGSHRMQVSLIPFSACGSWVRWLDPTHYALCTPHSSAFSATHCLPPPHRRPHHAHYTCTHTTARAPTTAFVLPLPHRLPTPATFYDFPATLTFFSPLHRTPHCLPAHLGARYHTLSPFTHGLLPSTPHYG